MTKKPDNVQKLLDQVQPRTRLPKPVKDANLLEQGMMVALVRHLPQAEAERVLRELRKAYPDWNELRVAQVQEIASLVSTGDRRAPREKYESLLSAAGAAREYLQEIFQKNHGFDLEFLREDLIGGAKTFAQMPYLGLAGTSYLLWLAADRQIPPHPALLRVLERLGILAKGASLKKGRDLLTPIVPEGKVLEFVAVFGEVADRWCHKEKPLCHECLLVDDCAFGRKAYKEWKVQQARLEAARQKEEARRAVLEKKEAERRAREDARNAKKAAQEAAKAERERQRQARIDAKRKAAEAAMKAKMDAAAKRVAAEAARKAAAEAKKAQAAQKKAEAEAKKAREREKLAKTKSAAKPKKSSGAKAPKAAKPRSARAAKSGKPKKQKPAARKR